MTVISINLSDDLINKIDSIIRTHGYVSRSEFIREALRRFLSEEEISENDIVIASITIVVKERKRSIEGNIMHLIHKHSPRILSLTHLQEDEMCIESIICKGTKSSIQNLLLELRRLRGEILVRESIIPI